ncbi:MAG: biotin/lipoyl-containing protein [Bacteroidota bacterium]|nr:biotin/lipoyl-containing protein [Bacteroidota bacterium]
MENENTPVEPVKYKKFNLEGSTYLTLYSKKFEEHKPYEPYDPKKITAFLPGTILKIFVKEKEKVKKGEPLLVLQAMKMNNVLTAPVNGVIKKVNIKIGETVPKAHILVEFK